MAEARSYVSELAAIAVTNTNGLSVPVGMVTNFRCSLNFIIEDVIEWGSYETVEQLLHGYNATFSWNRAYGPGLDLVGQGLIPSSQEIANFNPIGIRVIDTQKQRIVVSIYKALIETITIGADARARLMSDVSGRAVGLKLESELQ